MNKAIQVLIVDNDSSANREKEIIIKESGLSDQVKVAMNSGHALLYLDHIHLNQKINDFHLLILLNMNTPIADGFDFLHAFRDSSYFKKEKIHIVIMNENLNDEKLEKIKKLGVSDLIPNPMPVDSLNEIVNTCFKYNSIVKGNRKNITKETPLVAARGV